MQSKLCGNHRACGVHIEQQFTLETIPMNLNKSLSPEKSHFSSVKTKLTRRRRHRRRRKRRYNFQRDTKDEKIAKKHSKDSETIRNEVLDTNTKENTTIRRNIKPVYSNMILPPIIFTKTSINNDSVDENTTIQAPEKKTNQITSNITALPYPSDVNLIMTIPMEKLNLWIDAKEVERFVGMF